MTKSETDRFAIERMCARPACLWVILFIAALFRLPFLAANPISVHADEASSGYDAYSIWETGKDQHGEFFPLFARSFGEYNEALHRYILAPSVALFGLNAFAILDHVDFHWEKVHHIKDPSGQEVISLIEATYQ
ncbi:MAG: hypothetical protein O3B73_08360 [bacterium]|nr:hypothetical protein [bacterium]